MRIAGWVVAGSLLLVPPCVTGEDLLPQKERKGDEPTVITSNSLLVDYEKNVATFTDEVVVDDPGGNMEADRMVVSFDPKQKRIIRIDASGNVRIQYEDKRSLSEKATYTTRDGVIVLTGNPKIRQGRNVYGADKITIFKNESRMLFEPKAKLMYYYDEQEREKALF